jgi:hypothetical protein
MQYPCAKAVYSTWRATSTPLQAEAHNHSWLIGQKQHLTGTIHTDSTKRHPSLNPFDRLTTLPVPAGSFSR